MPETSARGESRPQGHMPQLDGLRAFAAMAVLLFHFLGPKNVINKILPWGGLGVHLFFVLSGFLITGILLRCKVQVESGNATTGRELRIFYLRRGLRIFPIYYLTLAVVWFADLPFARETHGWNLCYGSNFLIARNEAWIGSMSHFWSLSVEEQFYLIWPITVLLTPRVHLEKIFVLAVIIAPISRIVWLALDGSPWGIVLPNACLDTLGMGALLALYCDPKSGDAQKQARLTQLGFWAGVLGLITLQAVAICGAGTRFVAELEQSCTLLFSAVSGLLFVWIVDRCAAGKSAAWCRRILCNPIISYLGKISYGIYLFHAFIPVAWKMLPQWTGVNIELNSTQKSLIFIALTIALASLSWHLYECPINRLKKYFEYEKKNVAPSRKV